MFHGKPLITSVCALLLLGACARESARPQAGASPAASALPAGQVALDAASQKSIGLALQAVERRAIRSELEATGKVALIPDREAHVTVSVSGRMLRIFKRLGDHVEKGTPLAVLDSPDLGQAQSDFLQAEAQLRLKKEAFDRQSGLFQKQFAAKKDLMQAKSDYTAAGIEYERATNKLLLLGVPRRAIARLAASRKMDSTMTIYAPIHGTITSKTLTLGENIPAGNSIYTVDDMSQLWVVADIHEQDLARVKPGAAATLSAVAYPGRHFSGRVETISESLTSDTHVAQARIAIANASGLLRPQMYVNARLASAETSSLPAVPAAAVILDGKERILYVEQDPGRFVRRAIECGGEANGFIAIKRGVKVGERVVAKGALLLDAQGKGG